MQSKATIAQDLQALGFEFTAVLFNSQISTGFSRELSVLALEQKAWEPNAAATWLINYSQ